MENINKIFTELAEQTGVQLKKYWECVAKKRFEFSILLQMNDKMQQLNTQTDKLLELCDASLAVANSVHKPGAEGKES